MSSDKHPEALIPPTGNLTLKNPTVKGESAELKLPNAVDRDKELKKRNKKPKERKATTSTLQGILTFLMLGGMMAALFYDRHWGTGYLTLQQFKWIRVSLVVGAYAVLVIEAFQHNMIQGVLCVFFPPYAIIYGLLFGDGGASKGFTFAICLFLGTEWYMKPKDSFVSNTGTNINKVIEDINARISGSKREDPF